MCGVASPYVNYGRGAGDYAKHRTPTQAQLFTWASAMCPYMENVNFAIDLGAGTGGFSAALRDWGAENVVAIEPSVVMQAEAATTTGVRKVTGRAEAIPLRSNSADLIWISTAFHHFVDPRRSAQECRRVLVDGGRVAIRGFVPGHTQLPWLDLFPGSEKAFARFPDLGSMNTLFSESGFDLVHGQLVEEGIETYGERADFSDRMRHVDSILTAMSDAEVEAGIRALRSRPNEIEHFALSLLIYRTRPPPRNAGFERTRQSRSPDSGGADGPLQSKSE
jgi:ubiquinone/menaquinone biosynthesis C-methylase UbiE